MLVAVFNKVEIPWSVTLRATTYIFEPQCEMPDDLGAKICKNQPDVYFEVPHGKVLDVSEYKVKDVFQGKTIAEIFNTFPEKERIEIYAFVKKKAQEVRKREMKKKEEEIKANIPVIPDALQSALSLENVDKEKLNEVAEESKKPDIKKVR